MSQPLPTDAVRPTQLFLSRAKLAAVLESFEVDSLAADPLPVFERDGEWYLADGHTRAFAASLAGAEELWVERDAAVREETDFGVYLTCIEWCEAAGVTSVADLHGRVLEPGTYEAEWIDRCHALDAHSGE